MALLDANIQAARVTFETLVDSAFEKSRSAGLESRFSRAFSGSNGLSVELNLPGAHPAFEDWTDEAHFSGVRMYKKTINFGKKKVGIELKREDVVYDKSGAVGQALARLASDTPYLKEKMVIEKLATNPTGLDGVSLLNDSHPFGSVTTWDNLVTTSLSFDTFNTGRAAMRTLLDEHAEPLQIEPDVLLVHPDEERVALEIAKADERPISVGTAGAINTAGVGGAQVTNVYRGIVDVVVSPRWTSGDWLLMDSRYAPIALATWREPESVITDDMSGESRQRRDVFLYAVEADIRAEGLYPYGVYGAIA